LAKDILTETLDAICAMDAPLTAKLEAFVEKQRAWKTPFLAAGERLVERLRAGVFGREAPQNRGADAQFSAAGSEWAAAPDRQAFVAQMPGEIRRRTTILSDIDNEYALSLGIAIWLGDELKALMTSQGLDLREVHGNDHWCLPLPATFVLARGEKILARKIEPDFRARMSVEDITAVLQRAAHRQRTTS
jgi:hypothetical protein